MHKALMENGFGLDLYISIFMVKMCYILQF